MANNTREIRRRIKATENIGKITKAMELVSAAKMRKAQAAAISSRPYATLSAELLKNLASKADLSNQPLMNRVIENEWDNNHFERSEKSLMKGISPVGRDGKNQKVLIVLISSDRGLAGAFNSNVISKAIAIAKDEGASKVDFITVGRKGADAIGRFGYNMVAAFPAKDKGISLLDAQPIAQIAIQDYLAFKYAKVFVVYTDFVSTLVQRPNILQLLPFVETGIGDRGSGSEEFLFEPSPDDVLETLISRTIEFAVLQSLVEAAASEHSARMVAMRNANEAAGDLIEDLSLTFNQARQAGITRELSEISAAKLAMEG
jgi:F-type H+-transporting ATPase subunit gamma